MFDHCCYRCWFRHHHRFHRPHRPDYSCILCVYYFHSLLITSLTIMFATQQHLFINSVTANVSFNLIHAPTIHTRKHDVDVIWRDDDTFYWNTKCHTTCYKIQQRKIIQHPQAPDNKAWWKPHGSHDCVINYNTFWDFIFHFNLSILKCFKDIQENEYSCWNQCIGNKSFESIEGKRYSKIATVGSTSTNHLLKMRAWGCVSSKTHNPIQADR